MDNYTLAIGSRSDLFFKQVVRLLKEPLLSHLRNRELDVLAELLRVHDIYKDQEDHIKWRMVFHRDTKETMRDNLGMKRTNFDNHHGALKRKGIIKTDLDGNERIREDLIVTLDGDRFVIAFDLRIDTTDDTIQEDQEETHEEEKQQEEQQQQQRTQA